MQKTLSKSRKGLFELGGTSSKLPTIYFFAVAKSSVEMHLMGRVKTKTTRNWTAGFSLGFPLPSLNVGVTAVLTHSHMKCTRRGKHPLLCFLRHTFSGRSNGTPQEQTRIWGKEPPSVDGPNPAPVGMDETLLRG